MLERSLQKRDFLFLKFAVNEENRLPAVNKMARSARKGFSGGPRSSEAWKSLVYGTHHTII
jgi:hypothetical protein